MQMMQHFGTVASSAKLMTSSDKAMLEGMRDMQSDGIERHVMEAFVHMQRYWHSFIEAFKDVDDPSFIIHSFRHSFIQAFKDIDN